LAKSAFDLLRNQVQKDLRGAVRIHDVTEMVTPFHLRRPSGVLGLDLKTDGGMPGGSIVQLHGRDGVSKTGLGFNYLGENQRVYGEDSAIFVASFGYKQDLPYMRMCGMQLELSDQELVELGYDDPASAPPDVRGHTVGEVFFLDLGESALADEAPSEAIFSAATKLVESGLFQIGMIDEFGSGETKDVVVKGLQESVRVATWANLVTRWCQRMYTVLRKPLVGGAPNATTVFVINPARAPIDTTGRSSRYTPADKMTSGYALKHAKAVDLLLKSGAQVRKGSNRIGKEVIWKISKGKHGLHEGISGTYVWLDNIGVDKVTELVNAAKIYDTIHRAGRWYRVLDYDDKIEGGLDGVAALLREDADLYREVYAATLKEAQEALVEDDEEPSVDDI